MNAVTSQNLVLSRSLNAIMLTGMVIISMFVTSYYHELGYFNYWNINRELIEIPMMKMIPIILKNAPVVFAVIIVTLLLNRAWDHLTAAIRKNGRHAKLRFIVFSVSTILLLSALLVFVYVRAIQYHIPQTEFFAIQFSQYCLTFITLAMFMFGHKIKDRYSQLFKPVVLFLIFSTLLAQITYVQGGFDAHRDAEQSVSNTERFVIRSYDHFIIYGYFKNEAAGKTLYLSVGPHSLEVTSQQWPPIGHRNEEKVIF